MTQEEKIRDLEERLDLIKVDNSRLLEELRQCKKAASGYKGKKCPVSERTERPQRTVGEHEDAYGAL